jgi:hypothetical protein
VRVCVSIPRELDPVATRFFFGCRGALSHSVNQSVAALETDDGERGGGVGDAEGWVGITVPGPRPTP